MIKGSQMVGFSYYYSLPATHILQYILCVREIMRSDMASCALGGKTCSCLHFTDAATEGAGGHVTSHYLPYTQYVLQNVCGWE